MQFIRLHNLRLELEADERSLRGLAAEQLGISESSIKALRIVRRSLDARHKKRLQWVYTLDVNVAEPGRLAERLGMSIVNEQDDPFDVLSPGDEPLRGRPVVVGCGPAGIFAAYLLARFGYNPLLVERGQNVSSRVRAVKKFWNSGDLDPESNLLFGEGGAGTFSDGKLTSRSSDILVPFILRLLVEHGAPDQVLYDAKPHVGSDRLRAVLVALRKKMESMGVEHRFGCRLEDIHVRDGVLHAVTAGGATIECGPVIFAIGHSARDTYSMLLERGVAVEFKPFQFGARVEHPQELIDRIQYGDYAGHPRLGPADYSLVRKHRKGRRAVFTFCMCPGGIIVPSVNEPRTLCTNGMSNYARNSGWASSGIVTTITEQDVRGKHPLKGVYYQADVERRAFKAGGSNYAAPAQVIQDFLRSRCSSALPASSYPLGLQKADLREVLPAAVARAISSALKEFAHALPGFDGPEGIITGPDARGSSPVRIVRDSHTRESISVRGLYPAGEGAGYAGGIVSAALDGLRTAVRIIQRYAPLHSS